MTTLLGRAAFFSAGQKLFLMLTNKGYSDQQCFPLIMSLTSALSASETLAEHPSTIRSLRTLALPALFACFGLIMGSWVGRIPALRDGVHLSHSQLSMVLLMGGLGAVLSFPLSTRLMARFGGRLTMLIAGYGLLIALMAIGAAPTLPLLMTAVLMLGMAASTFDVGMNAVAARQEGVRNKSLMATLHACACAGGLAGVTLGSGMAAMHIKPLLHYAMLALPLALLLRSGTDLLDVDRGTPMTKKSFVIPRGDLVLLGALGFLAAIAEGSIADWAGIFMTDHFGASDGVAPLSLSAFSTMMLLSRSIGDHLKASHGAKRLVSGGAMLAAAGMFFAVCAPNQYLALGGFAVAGMGLSLAFPFVFSAAGREGPAALAGVATMAYSGSLIGPPVLGAIAHYFGLELAMGFIASIGIMIALVTTRTRLMK